MPGNCELTQSTPKLSANKAKTRAPKAEPAAIQIAKLHHLFGVIMALEIRIPSFGIMRMKLSKAESKAIKGWYHGRREYFLRFFKKLFVLDTYITPLSTANRVVLATIIQRTTPCIRGATPTALRISFERFVPIKNKVRTKVRRATDSTM